MDLHSVKKMFICNDEQLSRRESGKLWKNLRKRYTYDEHLCALFSEAFKNFDDFHEWRTKRYPICKYGYTLTYLYDHRGIAPTSIEQYQWVPKKIWEFFFSRGSTLTKYEYPGVQMSNTIRKSYYASIMLKGENKHLGSAPTALAAHKLWQKAKLIILQDLYHRYRYEIPDVVVLWLESWIITFENNIANDIPTFLWLTSKEFEDE